MRRIGLVVSLVFFIIWTSICWGQLFMKDVLFDRLSTRLLFKGSDVADPPERVRLGAILYYQVAGVQYRSGKHGEDLTAAYTMRVTVAGIERGAVALSVLMMSRDGMAMGDSIVVNPGAGGFWLRGEYLTPREEPDFGLKVSPGNVVEIFDVNTGERLYQAVYGEDGLLLSLKFTRGPEGVKGSIKEIAQLMRVSSLPPELIPAEVRVPDWFRPGVVLNYSTATTDPWTGLTAEGETSATIYRVGGTWAEYLRRSAIAWSGVEVKRQYAPFGLGACPFWGDPLFLSKLAERETSWDDEVLGLSTRVYRSELEGKRVIVVESSSLATGYKSQEFYEEGTGLMLYSKLLIPFAFGVPEVFEMRYEGRGSADLSALDSDGDGFSDAEEVAAMTDPFNSRDFPRRDTTPPAVTLISPAAGSIEPDVSFRLGFSEPVDRGSLEGAVELLQDGEAVPFELSYDPASNSLSIVPKEPLRRGAAVRLIVRGSVRDLSGNEMGEDAVFEFRVAGARWDLNGDGRTDIFDIVMVARRFGTRSREADLNGDGVVDIFDIVLLARHIGEGAGGAPPLLGDLVLPAYPNPCNPDVWIPFILLAPSEVRVRIYSLTGRLVREIDLGLKEAGVYVERGRAAHWDGRDSDGFPVPSGVYIVQLLTRRGVFSSKVVVLR